MKLFELLRKVLFSHTLNLYLITFNNSPYVFGVTATNSEEALQLVYEKVFHNQTIPILPIIEKLTVSEARTNAIKLKVKICKTKGIWQSNL
jgi:hypothetical protein